jgi:hypothetical protein
MGAVTLVTAQMCVHPGRGPVRGRTPTPSLAPVQNTEMYSPWGSSLPRPPGAGAGARSAIPVGEWSDPWQLGAVN